MCAKNIGERHIAIIALNDFGCGLNGTYYGAYAYSLLGCDLINFVEKDDIAELNLLNNEIFYIVFTHTVGSEGIAAGKLALHAQGIDHCNDAIEHGNAVALQLRGEIAP